MIVTDLSEQTMTCDVCREVYELPRRLLRDQHALLEMQDDTSHDHRECAARPDNPALAIMSRLFRKQIEFEATRSETA